MDEDRRVALLPAYGKAFFRDWECVCGNKYTKMVQLSAHTPNLSGESTQFCPKCGAKPLRGSAAYQK